jgi:hypothetical protein
MLLPLLWTSCGDGGRGISYASSYRGKGDPGPSVPVLGPSADKVVRPDLMVVSFSFWKTAATTEGMLPTLKSTVDQYVRAVVDATKAEVAVKMRGFQVNHVTWEDDKPGRQLSVHGNLEVTLPPTMDYWARSELMAALSREADQTQLVADKAGIKSSVSLPVVMLKDPEAHRAELMKRWVEQSRAFAAAAQGERPLQLASCALPGAVEQQVVTLEEVVLKLAMNCQLEATAAAK